MLQSSPLTRKVTRKKKCANPSCGDSFVEERMGQSACSIACAIVVGRLDAGKKERKQDAVRREKLKTRSDYIKEAQRAFNAWIKARDAALPCVSCGRHHTGAYHAGHYLSVGARPELRFEPLNVWKQCAPCNTYLSGNLVLYRQELIRRIGIDKVEWLEGPHETPKQTAEDLQQMAKRYRALARTLKEKKC